ncbi:MAG: hypothetical protein PHV59_03340, partial [Victivallales bacterium]|nr:hypothetical protein [Victivallales bacterium]
VFMAYGKLTSLTENFSRSFSDICFTVIPFISIPAQLFGAKSLLFIKLKANQLLRYFESPSFRLTR